MASDWRVRAGSSRSERRRFCLGAPPTKLQRKGAKAPSFAWNSRNARAFVTAAATNARAFLEFQARSEEHTSELQSLAYLVCRLLLEKKTKKLRSGRLRSLRG